MKKKLQKKPLCEWPKATFKKNFEEMADIVAAPKYMCTSCARASRLKTTLCKPKKLIAA
jgi:hypothetical protein